MGTDDDRRGGEHNADGLSRRRLLAKASMVGAAAWVAPVIVSTGAAAAASAPGGECITATPRCLEGDGGGYFLTNVCDRPVFATGTIFGSTSVPPGGGTGLLVPDGETGVVQVFEVDDKGFPGLLIQTLTMTNPCP
jgi:hypothetical protein